MSIWIFMSTFLFYFFFHSIHKVLIESIQLKIVLGHVEKSTTETDGKKKNKIYRKVFFIREQKAINLIETLIPRVSKKDTCGFAPTNVTGLFLGRKNSNEIVILKEKVKNVSPDWMKCNEWHILLSLWFYTGSVLDGTHGTMQKVKVTSFLLAIVESITVSLKVSLCRVWETESWWLNAWTTRIRTLHPTNGM